jgi:tRNA(Ile)-lysidine synthase
MPAADQHSSRREAGTDASLAWPDREKITRFEQGLARLLPDRGRIGVAVSGGPDSLALLLLTAAARPGEIEAATVDHGLRPDSAMEAAMVAAICATLGVPHFVLRVTVAPGASLQSKAREARYAELGDWATQRRLAAILTAHHSDDQAETLLMRLARGSGLAGLAGVRSRRSLGETVQIARPLLSWRKSELEAIVQAARLTPIEDPANSDPRHDRTGARGFLSGQNWLDAERLAASAAHLAEAEEALSFAAKRLFAERQDRGEHGIQLTAADLPRELQRRLIHLALTELGASPPRGPDLDRALTTLHTGGICTLGGIKLEGGAQWRLSPAPPRR